MPGHDNGQFRVTPEPSQPFPRPWYRNRTYALDESATVLYPTSPLEDSGYVETNGEVYLRLLEIDLHDAGAILAFVNEFSILGVREASLPLPDFHIYDLDKSWATSARRSAA